MRTPNPPIKGHELLHEGLVLYVARSGVHTGGCRCGDKPQDFPHVSRRKMRDWHRGHKAALRRG